MKTYCPVCNHRFLYLGNLRLHLEGKRNRCVHSEVEIYWSCHLCINSSFSEISTLVRHLKNHQSCNVEDSFDLESNKSRDDEDEDVMMQDEVRYYGIEIIFIILLRIFINIPRSQA